MNTWLADILAAIFNFVLDNFSHHHSDSLILQTYILKPARNQKCIPNGSIGKDIVT